MSKILYIIIAVIATIAVGSAAPLTTSDVITLPQLGEVSVTSTTTISQTSVEVQTSITYEDYQAIDNATRVALITPPIEAIKSAVPSGEKYSVVLTVRASNQKALLVYRTSDILTSDITEDVKYANEKGRV